MTKIEEILRDAETSNEGRSAPDDATELVRRLAEQCVMLEKSVRLLVNLVQP